MRAPSAGRTRLATASRQDKGEMTHFHQTKAAPSLPCISLRTHTHLVYLVLNALRGEAYGLGSPQAVPSSQARQHTNLLTDQEGARGHTRLQLMVFQRPVSWPYIWYAYKRQVGHGLSCEERGARPPDLTLKDMIGPCRVVPAHGSVTCKKLVGLIQQTVYPRNKGTDRTGLDADNEKVQSMRLT